MPSVDIKGHPSIEAYRPGARAMQITICASCERLSSVLFLSKDRWFCTGCRKEGDARPSQVAITNPNRKRVN